MKLAILISTLLAFPAVAGADIIHPPSGPVLVEDAAPQPQRPRKAQAQKLRRALLEQFDVNGDGRLGPRERMRAIRILRKIEHRLAQGQGQQQQGKAGKRQRMRRFIDRHDRNGDGDLGPGELPRGAAGKLRRFDRDGNGWVEERELGQ
jgi:hypothetical protein